MTGFRQAIAFLTRVPLAGAHGVDKAAAWFPLVGALVGVTVAGAYWTLFPWVPSLLAAVIAVTLGVLLTGAFHEDGLADSFDALGSGETGQAALRIMRDSRLGTYGTMAVILSVGWRVVALGSLHPAGAVAGLVMAHSLGRAGAVVLLAFSPPARPDGLGSSSASTVTTGSVWFAAISGLVVSTLAAGLLVGAALVAVCLSALILRRTALRRLGGVTGDIVGACEQISEMLVLAIASAAAWRGWAPWWAGPSLG
jgi:adenosylcobinamide-GDP ribazoletransferase